ncbi:MAG TPA: UbiA family prenyltransferase [Nitrososphaeraceae archaeon]|nr:UbiA family prenyltransferase [Nitrososphaeraceae archaeon]
MLVTISILLYCVGLVLNDLFDYEVDKKERPNRPLASGKISKKAAMILVTILAAISLILSLLVSVTTFSISVLLLVIIFGYDKYLKNTQAGPFTIAAARVGNIILGTTVNISNIENFPQNFLLIFILTITFVYVSLIGFLSRYEVQGFSVKIRSYLIPSIIAGIIFSIVIFNLIGLLKYQSLLILALFSFIMAKTIYRIHNKESTGIQQAIKQMILSIIVLDSTFLTGIAGLEIGLPVLILLAPLLVLAKKMYMT